MTEKLLRITIAGLAQKGENLELAKLRRELALIIREQQLGDGISSTEKHRPIEESIETFWSMVRIGKEDECWPWTRFTNRDGYGMFALINKHLKSRSQSAHRVAFMASGKTIPPEFMVCHTCDNPPCCNPGHLFTATQIINIKDRDSKGRSRRDHNGRYAIINA